MEFFLVSRTLTNEFSSKWFWLRNPLTSTKESIFWWKRNQFQNLNFESRRVELLLLRSFFSEKYKFKSTKSPTLSFTEKLKNTMSESESS